MRKEFYKELNQLRQMYDEKKVFGDQDYLSAYAVLDEDTEKYHVKILDEEFNMIYILKSQRENNARPMSLESAATNIRKIGFAEFTVLLEGDVQQPIDKL